MHPCLPLTIEQSWNGHPLPLPEQIRLELEFRPNGLLIDVEAPFYGDPSPTAEPGPCWELWEHEVVEVFIANGEEYTEIELGPQGHYLVLCLKGYRNIVSKLHPIRYRIYPSPGRWLGTALVPPEFLPKTPWTFNAYAIHGQGAARQYQARFPFPGEAPDFHQLKSFQALEFRLGKNKV